MATVDGVNEHPIRLVIIDDDPLVRTGLGLILGGAPDLQVVAEGADGDEAAALVATHRPDIVLMDIRMARLDGLSATAKLLERADAPKVIVLTTFDSDDLVLRALAAGASGFLLKDTPLERMIEAIRAVDAGETSLSPSVIAQVVSVATRQATDDRRLTAIRQLKALSEREHEVALAIGQGKSNAEIGKELYMSLATVKAYVTRILVKLGAVNRVQVAIRVHDAGLV